MSASPYDRDLDRNAANFQPLTPLTFLERAATVFPDRLAVAHGRLRRNYREFHARSKKLASALAKRGFVRGDTVAVMLANTPAMLECHYGVPMCGAVLNALNTRLDAASIAFMLDHGEAKALIVDREFSGVIGAALKLAKARPLVIDYEDPEYDAPGERLGGIDYEALVAEGDEAYERSAPADEWDAIALNYTSGTTGDPKGVVYHHRGANLLAIGNVVTADMGAIRSISGRCRCSIATAGAFPGRSASRRACMSACGRCAPNRSSTSSPSTRSPTCAARRSSCPSCSTRATTRSGRCPTSCASSPPPPRRPPPCSRRWARPASRSLISMV